MRIDTSRQTTDTTVPTRQAKWVPPRIEAPSMTSMLDASPPGDATLKSSAKIATPSADAM